MAAPSARILALLSLLQARRDRPGQLLAERLDVSERTVRRDVDRLRELGYRVRAVKGPDGGYRLDAGSELPPLLFDDEQAVAIALALTTATGPGDGAARALATVRQVMPPRLRQRIDALRVTAAVDRPAVAVPDEVLVAVGTAVRERQTIRFDYEHGPAWPGSVSGSESDITPDLPRHVEPHHLVVRSGRWYLVGWDLDRDDWRVFRADRVAPRMPTRRPFVPRALPGGDVGTFLTARFRGRESPARDGDDAWPCTGTVVLGTAASTVAPFVGDDGLVEELGPDRCRLVLGAWSWAGLAARIAQFDAPIEVERPAALADAYAVLAARAAAAARGAAAAAASGA